MNLTLKHNGPYEYCAVKSGQPSLFEVRIITKHLKTVHVYVAVRVCDDQRYQGDLLKNFV